jgi:hypothetical protein
MDIFLQDPTDIPVPPDEVRIRELRAEVLPDQRRVRIYLALTPFQKRPNGEIKVINERGTEVASISIIEAIDPKMQLTIHLPQSESTGEHTLSTVIYYYSEELFQFEANAPTEDTTVELPNERQVVDSQQTTFSVAHPSEAE